MNISQKGESPCLRKMAQVTGLIIQHTIISVGSMTLVTPEAVIFVIELREVLFGVGPYLQGRKHREVIGFATLQGMTAFAGSLKVSRMNRRPRVPFLADSMSGVTGLALRPAIDGG
jgi:hypothetical protein